MLRVAYLLSHPIQYQSPLLRRLAAQSSVDLTVLYMSDFSLRSYSDEGFGVPVAWDVPLLDGYHAEFLPRLLDGPPVNFFRPLCHGIFSRLRRGGFDVLWLHGYASLNALQAMLAAKLLGIPVLLRTDSTRIDRPRGRIKLLLKDVFFRLLRPFVFGALSVGKQNTDYWRHHLGSDVRIYPMPYAVDNDFFAQQAALAAPQREEFRASLGLQPGRAVILFAAKLIARKRCIDLVEAYLLYVKNLPESTRPYLLIAGDGEERAAIEARIAQAGATRDIRLLGFRNQTQLPPLYDLCDLFVLPSVHEPWGLAVNEVMAVGRAVIVSDQVGCQPDLVTEGDNGCVFPAGDIHVLSAALGRVLSDPQTCRAMGERSRARIAHYTFDHGISGLLAAFTDAAQQRQNHQPPATSTHRGDPQ
jgi:glycosyltransferase involved in cell wall biosynthesis